MAILPASSFSNFIKFDGLKNRQHLDPICSVHTEAIWQKFFIIHVEDEKMGHMLASYSLQDLNKNLQENISNLTKAAGTSFYFSFLQFPGLDM